MKLFTVLPVRGHPPSKPANKAYLITDMWDDWSKYRTQFQLIVIGKDGQHINVGSVKIAAKGLQPSSEAKPGYRAPVLDDEFDSLGEEFFSLGQEETYYEELNNLEPDFRVRILTGLKDCAYDLDRFRKYHSELAMTQSLLRSVVEQTVTTRLHRLAHGDARLTSFHFGFVIPGHSNTGKELKLEFSVAPNTSPPTNVHVLIGRNGVGKSRCMQRMASIVSSTKEISSNQGALFKVDSSTNRDFLDDSESWSFAGLVLVSFSAFDDLVVVKPVEGAIPAAIIGLQKHDPEDADESVVAKSKEDLVREFTRSFEVCSKGMKAQRLRRALATLSSDPLFADADIASLLETDRATIAVSGAQKFSSLSSGHAIVLLAITRLVELVDEKTLVLFDEPESHLHPPLLAALIRALTDLLISRNGVAIVATHSPVVLQEVPKSCVWKMFRDGDVAWAERPEIETFGENVGVLTREAFGLEVTEAGFHRLIRQAVEAQRLSYEGVLEAFGENLGAEARAIARALTASNHNESSGAT